MMPACPRRAVVTGAAGFVGANLVKALAQGGCQVHALARPASDCWRLRPTAGNPPVERVDLCDPAALAEVVAKLQPDVVFNCASASVHHPATAADRMRAMADTVTATVNLCEAVAAAGVRRLVHLGSSLEYEPMRHPVGEDTPMRPVTFRGASKAAAALLCRQMSAEAGFEAVVLRLFAVYGPWENPTRFVPAVMAALASGAPLPLTRQGIARDFVFVGDVVDACLLASCSSSAAGQVFNIGSGVATTNEELVACAERVSGRRASVRPGEYPDRAVDGAVVVADVRRAGSVLGWRPAHSLEQGLARTWEWASGRTGPR